MGKRLGLAFGTLVARLIAIAAFGLVALNGLNTSTTELADHDVPVLEKVQSVDARVENAGHLTVRHLYVFDGDLRTQDSVAKELAELRKDDDADLAGARRALDDPELAPLLVRYAAVRARFVSLYREAIARSRAETVRNDEERDGSRSFYTGRVAPALIETDRASDALVAGLVEETAKTKSEASGAAGRGRTLILLVALGAGLLAVGLAFLVVRSIVRPLRVVIERIELLRSACITGLNGGLQALAQGDLTHEVVPKTPEIENPAKDEVGDVARALNSMRIQMGEAIGAYNDSRGQLGELVGQVAGRRSR